MQSLGYDVQAFKGVNSDRFGNMLHIGLTSPLSTLSNDFAQALGWNPLDMDIFAGYACHECS